MPSPHKCFFLEFYPCINYISEHFNAFLTDFCSPVFCTVVAHPELLQRGAVVKPIHMLRQRRVHVSVRP